LENYKFALRAFEITKRLISNSKYGMYDKLRVSVDNHVTQCSTKGTRENTSLGHSEISAFEKQWLVIDTNVLMAELDEPVNDVNPQSM